MDYSTLTVIGRVARDSLVGARLRKPVGLKDGSLILAFDLFDADDADREFDNWLFCADPSQFRVHPWLDDVPQKSVASHLVEVASHHLSGAKVIDVAVTRFERIIILHFTRVEYTGEEIQYRLITELMGKHSNIILVDSSDVILASHKSIHAYQSRVREIRAGKKYESPPKQDRIEPREFTMQEWRDFIESADPGDQIDAHITHKFQGMSPKWAQEICDRAGISAEKVVGDLTQEEAENLRGAFLESLATVLDGIPLSGETPIDFVWRIATGFGERASEFTLERERREITQIIDRRRRKLRSLGEGLTRDLDQAGRAEEYKKKADLLLANLHIINPGTSQVVLNDWETGEKVPLSLDLHITPQLQAERWYERYRKLKRTGKVAMERRNAVLAEEEELGRLGETLATAESVEEILDIRDKCILHGLISSAGGGSARADKRQKTGGNAGVRPGRLASITTHRYRSNDGFLIIAGTSGRSNDALRRASAPEDVWLHVRDIPGSHVYIITRGHKVPETTLREAAMIAAWHSQARDGSNVPVDYTRARYVTPIPGAREGKVNFKRERTIRVTPDEKRIEMMRLLAGEGTIDNK